MSSKRRKSAPNKLCSSPDCSPLPAHCKLDTENGPLSQCTLHKDFDELEEEDAELEDQDSSVPALDHLCERQSTNEKISLSDDRLKPLQQLIESCKANCGLSGLTGPNLDETLTEQVDKVTIVRAQRRLNQIIEQLDKLRQRFMQKEIPDWQVRTHSVHGLICIDQLMLSHRGLINSFLN